MEIFLAWLGIQHSHILCPIFGFEQPIWGCTRNGFSTGYSCDPPTIYMADDVTWPRPVRLAGAKAVGGLTL
jgi:hypothetical protein